MQKKTRVIAKDKCFLGVLAVFRGGFSVALFSVYRSGNPSSPVFSDTFYDDLATAMRSADVPVVAGGDYNAKIGEHSAVPDELHHLVPITSARPIIDDEGWSLLANRHHSPLCSIGPRNSDNYQQASIWGWRVNYRLFLCFRLDFQFAITSWASNRTRINPFTVIFFSGSQIKHKSYWYPKQNCLQENW